MHCPNCGAPAAADQKFCRSCGFNLEKISHLLAEQSPAVEGAEPDRSKKAARLGFALLGLAALSFLVMAYGGIINEVIIGRGDLVGGILFLTIITAIFFGLGFIVFSASARKKKSARPPSEPPSLAEGEETLTLPPAGESTVVPSITEHTTNLLEEKQRGAGANDGSVHTRGNYHDMTS